MNKVFIVPPPIIVPDGTELHEIVGPRILGEYGQRISDGLSLAIGKLPCGIVSKIHVHPVVWHFTWVRRGTLTVKMKDVGSKDPYRLQVPVHSGVLTEAGTFFQLLNEGEEPCEVFYIVGPAFVFEASGSTVLHNDAVVFDQSWDELKQLNWQPPGLPSYLEMILKRRESLQRTAMASTLHTVQNERWILLNGPGSVAVPSELHLEFMKNLVTEVASPLEPKRIGLPSAEIMPMVDRFMSYLQANVGLQLEPRFLKSDLATFVALKCNQYPAVLAEYELAARLVSRTEAYIHADEVWHLLIFGQHAPRDRGTKPSALPETIAISRARYHVFNELFDFAVTIGGGFKATGSMENYRAYRGGRYLSSNSYNHYIDGPDGG